MRNIIKKISIIVMTFMFVCGAFLVSEKQNVYADGENVITVIFNYTRSDGKYSDYTIKAFRPSDSQGLQGEFTVSANEGVYEYKFVKNVDVDSDVSFIIQPKTSTEAEVRGDIDISTINSGTVEVNIDGDAKTFAVADNSSTTEIESQEQTEPETTVSSVSDDTEAVTTEKVDIPDDPNADYSVKTYMVVIIDVVFFVVMGALAYVVLSKKKNAFM